MVKVSVVCVTKRKFPYIDWALESLREQTFPHNEFEYILVDGYYHERKDEVSRMIEKMNLSFPVLHIPDKPTRWRGKRPAIASARNTGLILASLDTKYIIHHDDCCRFGKDWIEKHIGWLEKGYFVASGWIGYEYIDSNGIPVMGKLGPEYRTRQITEPKVVSATWFYCQNSSYPLDWALGINGFDEKYDGEFGQEDISFGIRLERNGYKMIFDPTNSTEVFVSTHYYEKLIPPVNLKLKDGTLHFSNEWLTEKLLDDKDRVMPYGNIIDIRTARSVMRDLGMGVSEMYKLMESSWIDNDLYDWRDGILISEKLANESKLEMKS